MHKIYIPPHTVFQQSLFWKYCMRGYIDFMDGGNMKYVKYYLAAGLIFTSVLGTLSHFFYDWSGQNAFIALFSPVSESTWEHMKLIFFPMLLFSLFGSTRLKEAAPSLTGALILGNLLGTLSIPILFYTYTGITGQNFFIADLAVFFTAVLTAWGAAWKLRDSAKVFRCRILLRSLAVLMCLLFFIFTFRVPGLPLFHA